MEERDDATRPVVVMDESGAVTDIASMNRKCYTKSTERGELWSLNEATGRVLPYREGLRLVSLEDRGRWFAAVVAAGSPALSGGPTPAGGPAPAAQPGGQAGGEAAAKTQAAEQEVRSGAEVLGRLWALIAQRKLERPTGSYTTYLFDSGEEKIRKKTGEEAVELILARKRPEIISESADLVYHLLVLLCQLDIPFDEVLGELGRRE
jgi:phosphoribosyl-ATP pyrophosphohydrolase